MRLLIRGILLVVLTVIPIHGLCRDDMTSLPEGISAEEVWTEHFHILYQETLRPAVPYLSRECESAYARLTRVFGWQPREKIDVLFVDTYDAHNGWATAIPHDRMGVFICGSDPLSSIFQPGSYLKRTIYHELAHVLSMDMRYGYDAAFSRVFGKINPVNGDPLSALMFYFSTSPVALAPDWYLEGMAEWAETEFAAPGRGRSTLADMVFRCAVMENNLLPYEKWDLDLPGWPYGLGAYLYGMKLVQYVDKVEKPDTPGVVGDLAQDLAHRFMFDFNNHSRKTTGMSFQLLYQMMIGHETEIQNENMKKLGSLAFTPVPRLTRPELTVYQPVYAGNLVYFVAREEDSRDTLYSYDPDTKETRKIGQSRLTAGFGCLRPSPDGKALYYTRLEEQRRGIHFFEVRRLDLQSRADTLITGSGRYRDIDLSADATTFIAVSMKAGRCSLIENRIPDAARPDEENILASGAFQEDISSPRYSPDSRFVSYVKSTDEGSALFVFNRADRRSELLYRSSHRLLFPTWSRDGSSIVFSSDLNGVYNLYRLPLGKQGLPLPLTHVPGGVFGMDFSPDGKQLAVAAYDSNGYFLSIIPYAPDTISVAELPAIAVRWPGKDGARAEAGQEGGTGTGSLAGRPYSSFRNVRFDYWSPWLTASSQGVMGGLEGGFSDAGGYQDLHLSVGAESHYGTGLGFAEYTYRGLYPVLRLLAGQEQEVFPNLLKTADHDYYDYAQKVKILGAAADIPLVRKMDRALELQIGYRFLEPDFIEESADEYRGVTVTPSHVRDESEGDAWARLSYADTTAFGRSSSLEDGRIVRVTAEKADPGMGGDIERARYLGEWNEYLPLPWAKNHVLKLSGTYGFLKGDRNETGLFGAGGFSPPYLSFGMPRSIPVRGYEENFQTGDHIAAVTCAYRLPVMSFFRGVSGSMPMYFRQVYLEAYYDGGMAWSRGRDDSRRWLSGMGTEVNYAVRLLRFLEIAPGIGFVYAPQQAGSHDDGEGRKFQVYLSVKGFINE